MSSKDEQYKKEIGARIKEVRVAEGLNQMDFSARLGVSQPTIYRVELAERLPSLSLIRELSRCFGVSLEWLINGDDTAGK